MDKKIAILFKNNEIMRIIDLAIRRMVDNEFDDYGINDKILFGKMQNCKMKFGKKYGDLL